jgi:hypothetical protein
MYQLTYLINSLDTRGNIEAYYGRQQGTYASNSSAGTNSPSIGQSFFTCKYCTSTKIPSTSADRSPAANPAPIRDFRLEVGGSPHRFFDDYTWNLDS